jgi:hypothetical protein
MQRHQKHSLENLSTLNYLKRKANPQSSVIIGQMSKRNCRICRDQFKEPQAIYSSHRGNSSKCPHFNVLPQPTNTVNTNLSYNINFTIPSTKVICLGNNDNESEIYVICTNNNDNVDNDSEVDQSEVEVTHTKSTFICKPARK